MALCEDLHKEAISLVKLMKKIQHQRNALLESGHRESDDVIKNIDNDLELVRENMCSIIEQMYREYLRGTCTIDVKDIKEHIEEPGD